jgi:hypothetical protein
MSIYPIDFYNEKEKRGFRANNIDELRSYCGKHSGCSKGFLSMAHKLDLMRILEIHGYTVTKR